MTLNENERLFLARKRAKLTQAELGEKLGISQGMVSHMETGFWAVSSDANAWIEAEVGAMDELQKWEEAAVLRRRLGLDIKQVAKEIGIPSWVLGKFEEGETPPNRTSELRLYCAWITKQKPPAI